MKLRKIIARTIAVVSCAALLSTNVLAATIETSNVDGKLQVVVSDIANEQVSFLAVTQDKTLAEAEADTTLIQGIDQKAAEDNTVTFTMGQRKNGAVVVDLYVGSTSVTGFKAESGVYVTKKITVVATEDLEYEAATANAFASINEAGLKEFLADKIEITYYDIGDIDGNEDATFTFTGEDEDLTFGTITADATNEVYTVPVKYEGYPIGNLTVTEVDPVVITDITIEGIPTVAPVVYVDALADFNETKARTELAKITGLVAKTTIEGSDEQGTIGLDKLGVVVEDGVVSFTYGEGEDAITIEETVTFDVIVIAPEAVADTYNKAITISGDAEGTRMDQAAIQAMFDGMDDYSELEGYAPKYALNKPGTTSDIPFADLTFTVGTIETGDEADTVEVAVAIKADHENEDVAGDAVGTIIVTINYAAKTVITGTVKATDATGQTLDVANATPAGAVVTAIPYNAEFMANYDDANVKSTVVDAAGNFELEVDENVKYTVIISHIKYVIMGGEILTSRTMLDGAKFEDIQLTAGEGRDLGAINLKYTFFGDLNLDGNLNARDLGSFRMNFGSTINE